MTQEEKELLIKDLCARLRYGVKCYSVITNGEPNTIGGYCEILDDFYIREVGGWFNISMIKPYLRPMSSMTDEEKEYVEELSNFKATPNIVRDNVDFYLEHHLDYRGLIQMGLALEALNNMYSTKIE